MGDATAPAWSLEARAETIDSVEILPDDGRATLTPPDDTRRDAATQAMQLLDQLREGSRLVVSEELLGSGGMSEVHVGTQRSLDRKVAVKLPKGDQADPKSTASEMLREAWITGQLEHPHVMPVYDLTLDTNGMPLIVLKRVDGLEWRTLLKDPELVKERFGTEDVLGWHLQIFMQVCNAIHFAHSRHIVHRDIKPSNVMIGEFGEVYVTDWGIAVSIRPGGIGAYDPEVLAGTPVYLAPEMVLGEPVSPETDVYLLGGTLFEILTGNPPHVAPSLREIAMKAIADESPDLGPSVPSELAAVCRTAMKRDRQHRYKTAEGLRRAVQSFLERRDSRELSAAALSDLAKLQAAMPKALADPEAPHAEVFDLFGACRFGFKAALRAWPDNSDARAGLETAVRTMIELELARMNARAAENLLADLADPSPDLRERVDQALRERATARDQHRALVAFRRELDPTVGRRGRFRGAAVFGALLVVGPLIQHFVIGPTDIGYRQVLGRPAVYLLALLVVTIWRRRELLANRYNRSLVYGASLLFLAELVFGMGHLLVGLDPILASIQQFAAAGFGIGMLGVFVDRRFLIAPIAYVAGFFVASTHPEWRYLISSCCNAALVCTLLWMWRPPQRSS